MVNCTLYTVVQLVVVMMYSVQWCTVYSVQCTVQCRRACCCDDTVYCGVHLPGHPLACRVPL